MSTFSKCCLCDQPSNNNECICTQCLSMSPHDLNSRRKVISKSLLESIGPIAKTSFDRLKILCDSATELMSKIQFNFDPERKFSTRTRHKIDRVAEKYLRQSNDSCLQSFIPLETNDDGNCLYHSIQQLMPRMKADINELRLRSMVMLVNNHKKYVQRYPKIGEVADKLLGYLCNIKDGEFSQLWDILALCDVLQCRIHSVWLKEPPHPYMNQTYTPLTSVNNDTMSEIVIMWTCDISEEDLRKTNKKWYPNHFVPLLPKDESLSIEPHVSSSNTHFSSIRK